MTLEQLLALRPHQIILERVPIEQLVVDSLFYPNCGMDGEIIRSCNERFEQLKICSFIYIDSTVTERDFLDGLDNFRTYKVFATRAIDLESYGFDDQPVTYNPRNAPFAYWTVFQRLDGHLAYEGPERFSLLFFGGAEANPDYYYHALYWDNRTVPEAIVGDAKLNNMNDPLTKEITRGLLPNLIFYKGEDEDDILDFSDSQEYRFLEDANVHLGPGGRGSVTIWQQL